MDYTFTIEKLDSYFYDKYPKHKITRRTSIKYESVNGGNRYNANIMEVYQNNTWNIIDSKDSSTLLE